jgi:hypothetical protein
MKWFIETGGAIESSAAIDEDGTIIYRLNRQQALCNWREDGALSIIIRRIHQKTIISFNILSSLTKQPSLDTLLSID